MEQRYKARYHRYNVSEKGHTRNRRYNASEKGWARQRRYRSRPEVQEHYAGLRRSLRLAWKIRENRW